MQRKQRVASCKRLAAAALAAGLLAAGAAEAAPYTLDKSHSSVVFEVSHLGFSTVAGRFQAFDADIDFNPDDPTASRVAFTIQSDSLTTFWEERDAHLKTADFFDVANHPTITFTSTSIEMTGENTAKITGDLTLLGETHPASFDVTLNKHDVSPIDDKLTLGVSGVAEIDRTSYGMDAFAPMISAVVPVRIELEAKAAE